MLKLNRFKVAGALALTIALGGTMVGCGGNGAADGSIQDTSQGVAATVKVKDKDDKEVTLEIGEKIVTQYVQDFRERNELTDDDAWAKWMADNALTPADVRTQVINYYEQDLLLEEAAKMYDVHVEESEVQEALQQIKDQFESEEAYQEALSATGMSEEEYIEKVLEPNTLQTKLAEAVEADQGETVDVDGQVLAMAQSMESVLDGGRRSSHILFAAGDDANAAEVAAQLQSGALSWDDAVAQYSVDEYTKENGGDNGWNTVTTFVDAYNNALVELEKDEISDPVTSDYGIHIIKCTDVWTVPEGGITSLDQLPTEIVDAMRLQIENTSSDTFTTWFSEFINSAELTINEMPENLPYNVDMSAYTATTDDQTQGTEGVEAVEGAEGTEAPVEGEPTAQPADEGEQPVDEGAESAEGEQPTEGAEGAEGENAEGGEGAAE
ncbi:MAG: hypothetical protein HFJ66_09630 [Eggerthellaceae bacterium]|nr:hypothetical protein [Eggerthellaceae bacterium]